MPVSVSIAFQTLRAGQHQLSDGPTVPRLWQVMRGEWQRVMDRATAQAVRKLDHAGVSEDYRMACRGS